MSLLDDVSIVVTPNGYKAGELYAVVPVPTEGAELLTNGDFASDLTGWTGYGTRSATGGVATIGASANSGIYQGILTEGVRYTVTVNVTSYDGVGTAEFANNNGINIYTITETGIQTFTFTHNIASSNLIIRGLSNALFSLSSVSVKEYTSADMDVTRATAATRVDEDGLVNYAEILGSEEVTNGDFSNGSTDWDLYQTGSSTVTFSDVASINIDGSNSNAGLYQENVFTNAKIYKIVLTMKATAVFIAEVLESQGAVTVSSIGQVSLTTSYQDFTFYFTATGTNDLFIHRLFGQTAGQNQQILIKNVSVKEVARDNVPRIDYTGGGCPHILAEPQRTNLVTYSENFSESGYGWNYTSDALELIELNSIVSPDGTQNADKIAKTATRVYANAHSPQNIVSNQLYSWSMFIKEGTHSIGYLSLTQGDTEYKSYFDLNNETSGMLSGSATTKLEDFGNGWYKCTLSNISSTTDLSVRFDFGMSYSTTNANWPSASEGNGLYMYYWGAQLEESYATSYILTSGSTVTRNQDIFTRDGIGSLINSTEGVLFVEMAALSDDGTDRAISLSDGTNNHRILLLYTSTTNQIQAFHNDNVSPVNLVFTVSDVTDFHKVAFKYKVNDFALWIDGVEVATNNLKGVNTANTLNVLKFENASGSSDFYGKVKQLQVYNTALTDAQLTSLTS